MRKTGIAAGALGAALIVGAVLPFASLSGAKAASPLSSFVLKKSDVPAALPQTANKADTIQTAAKNAKVSVATIRSKGWLGAYESNFEKTTKTTDSFIYSTVDQFKDANGVAWDLNNGLKIVEHAIPKTSTFSIRGIGQSALGVKASGKSQGYSYTVLFVAVRRGPYLAGIEMGAVGKLPAPSLAQAEHYASIVDARIKKG
jgi:hypothetical protein